MRPAIKISGLALIALLIGFASCWAGTSDSVTDPIMEGVSGAVQRGSGGLANVFKSANQIQDIQNNRLKGELLQQQLEDAKLQNEIRRLETEQTNNQK